MDGITADIMPIDPTILGFSNAWYAGALADSTVVIGSDGPIRLLNACRFCATKLESFASRGHHDFYHHDIEDFIAVVDGRPSLTTELTAAPPNLRDFVSGAVHELLSHAGFLDSLAGHLSPDEASQARLSLLLSRLYRIAELRKAGE